MSVRIIAGKYGGRTIETPKGFVTHPMSDRIRSSLFNSISSLLPDANVLDAFAGSGVLGLEAISRGAKNVTFIERDKKAQNVIQKNIDLLELSKQCRLVKGSVSMWCDSARSKYDIILADPPYNDMQLSSVKKLFGMLNAGGYMVLSYPGRDEVPKPSNEIVVVDNRSYKTAALVFYRREKDTK